MWIPLLVALIALALLLRALQQHAWLAGCAVIRRERAGWWLTREVLRRVGMQRLPAHVSEFPVPREERIQVFRCLGLVLWHHEVSLALPLSACERMQEVAARDYDRQFPAWLRLPDSGR